MLGPQSSRGNPVRPQQLTDKGLGILASEGHTIIRRIIEASDDHATADLQKWMHQLLKQTRDHIPRKPATVSKQNLGPVGITLSIDVIEDTLSLGPNIVCLQDTLLHGQDIRSIKDWRIHGRIPYFLRYRGTRER